VNFSSSLSRSGILRVSGQISDLKGRHIGFERFAELFDLAVAAGE
jgi:hypothetical protein